MECLKRIVVGVDFSPRSLSAAQMAVALAEPMNATIELVHVEEAFLSDADALVLKKSRENLLKLLIGEAETALDNFAKHLNYQRLRRTVISGKPALELARLAKELDVDLVVVGDTGAKSSSLPRGVGANAYHLVEQGPRNVLVVKAGYAGKVRSVAAAISFVPVADDVLQRASFIARLFQADLHIVRVIPDVTELRYKIAVLPFDIERIMSESVQYNEKRLNEFVKSHSIEDLETKTAVLSGKPGQALVEYLQNEGVDLVVMGTGTSIRLVGYPIGSATHRVLNQTLSSVCVVRSLETVI